MSRNTCRSCGAPVLWGRTEKGRQMPVDEGWVTEGVRYRFRPDGGLSRVTDEGQAGHVSHFATCPNAKRHRAAR